MRTGPTWSDLDRLTNGKWTTMPEEELVAIVEQCSRELEQHRLDWSWKCLCPPEYRDTIFERLPCRDKFDEVQQWTYGPQGLLLLGGTRRGKTRSVWKLLERLHYEGRTILPFTPMDLKLQVAEAWQDGEAQHWIFKLRNADVLFLDDLDTVKFTEAMEETIYDIFEHRPVHGKPVIVTVNQTGAVLALRMNASGRGVKIVERMREYCRVINLE